EDPARDPNNPNLYTYCANNPLRLVDQTGLSWVDTKVLTIEFGDNSYLVFSAATSDPNGMLAISNATLNARIYGYNFARFRCDVKHENFVQKSFARAFSFFGLEFGGPKIRNIELIDSHGFNKFAIPVAENDLSADIGAFLFQRIGMDTYGVAEKLADAIFGNSKVGMIVSSIIKVTS